MDYGHSCLIEVKGVVGEVGVPVAEDLLVDGRVVEAARGNFIA